MKHGACTGGVVGVLLCLCTFVGGAAAAQVATQYVEEGNSYYQRNEYRRAIAAYDAALKLNPQLGTAYFYLASSHENLYRIGSADEAEQDEHLRKAVANYRIAAARATDPQIRRLASEYLDYLIASVDDPRRLDDPAPPGHSTPKPALEARSAPARATAVTPAPKEAPKPVTPDAPTRATADIPTPAAPAPEALAPSAAPGPTAEPPATPPDSTTLSPVPRRASDYVIGPADVLAVTVWNQENLTGPYTVEIDGTFSFPLLGRVKAAGLTLRAFEAELKRRLADGFLKKPQVTVAIREYRSQHVFVVGDVAQPGTYTLTGEMTLIEALASAGASGNPSSSGEAIIVRTHGAAGPVLPGQDVSAEVIRVDIDALQRGALSQNIVLQDGDTVFVPAAEVAYVFGEVNQPGSYPIRRDTTVLQALSLAGGVTEFAATNRIRISRVVDGKEQKVKVKLTDLVRPGDTIIVPQRFF